MEYYSNILVSILAYLTGSIPTAYILLKVFFKKNITEEGSGNVGAMNSYEVTNNKILGIVVFLLDFLKSYLFLFILISQINDSMLIRLSAAFLILGHNYSIFIRLSGGRGLSPAAGVFAYINPFGIIIWVIMYFTSKIIINKNVHISTAIGLIGANIMLWASPIELLELFELHKFEDINDFRTLYIVISIFIISKLIKPIREALDLEENKS